MDFLDPNKKRSHRIKLYIGYMLMAIAVAMGSFLLLLFTSGYGIDGKGQVIQNGLAFIDSRPGGAQVYIEGLHNNYKGQAQTNARLTLKEGRYKVTLVKDGYRSWQREFNLEGGGIERMAYPFLFPENLVTKNMKQYDKQPGFVSVSPDRKWIVVQQPDNFLGFDVFDTSRPDTLRPQSISVPATAFSPATGAQSLELAEWSTDNNNILLKHVFDGKQEFVVVNRDKPEESFNVNTLLGFAPYNVVLKDKKIDELYVHTSPGGLLESVNIKTKALTPLAAKVINFKPHGADMLIYVSPQKDSADTASVRIQTNEKDYTLKQLPLSESYALDLAKFNDSWYVVAGASSDDKVYIYKDPVGMLTADSTSDKVVMARTLRIDKPQNVSFSANARLIAAQSGQHFAVYDAETDRQYRYDAAEQIDTSSPAKWMDGHRLVANTKQGSFIFDFDGINSQTLMPIVASTPTMFDRDYDYTYSLASVSDGDFALTQTKLTTGD